MALVPISEVATAIEVNGTQEYSGVQSDDSTYNVDVSASTQTLSQTFPVETVAADSDIQGDKKVFSKTGTHSYTVTAGEGQYYYDYTSGIEVLENGSVVATLASKGETHSGTVSGGEVAVRIQYTDANAYAIAFTVDLETDVSGVSVNGVTKS
jgi:hypothetical protein